MDFAVFDETSIVNGRPLADVYNDHLDMVAQAERLGFHSYWFAEHHFGSDRAAPSPNLMIAAASQRTSKILLGNMVNVLPFHHPVRLAEETAMLDHLTDGRLQFGIGRGVRPPEFRRYKVDMGSSREMFTESYDMQRELWTAEEVSAEGKWWSFDDVTIVPPVLQKPGPPVWCTGMSAESTRWAAERGLPFVTSFLGPEETRGLGEQYRAWFRPSDELSEPCFAIMRHMYVSDSWDTAVAEVGDVYDRLFHHWLDIALTTSKNVPDSYKAYPERHRRLGAMNLKQLNDEGLVLFGSSEDVAEGVHEQQRQGADLVMVWVSPWGVAPELAARSLERFGLEVMPRFLPASTGVVGTSE